MAETTDSEVLYDINVHHACGLTFRMETATASEVEGRLNELRASPTKPPFARVEAVKQ